MELGGTWTLSAPVQNTLTLDKAALSYDGKMYTELLPVPYISERLLRRKRTGSSGCVMRLRQITCRMI